MFVQFLFQEATSDQRTASIVVFWKLETSFSRVWGWNDQRGRSITLSISHKPIFPFTSKKTKTIFPFVPPKIFSSFSLGNGKRKKVAQWLKQNLNILVNTHSNVSLQIFFLQLLALCRIISVSLTTAEVSSRVATEWSTEKVAFGYLGPHAIPLWPVNTPQSSLLSAVIIVEYCSRSLEISMPVLEWGNEAH